MILLMMVDTPEEKRKFVILYENYRYLITITKHAAIDLYRRRNRAAYLYGTGGRTWSVRYFKKSSTKIQRYISVKIFRTSGKPGDCQNMRTSGGDDPAADCQRKTAN